MKKLWSVIKSNPEVTGYVILALLIFGACFLPALLWVVAAYVLLFAFFMRDESKIIGLILFIQPFYGIFNVPRIIFACDEVAELLDKTGLSKEDKDLISKIENKLAIIARQGRAFGIHLILATQRPDANILPGQIRNNIDFRVCGRADTVLSQIILDNTKAADEIPKHTQGRFITHDGKVFQGYMYDESTI